MEAINNKYVREIEFPKERSGAGFLLRMSKERLHIFLEMMEKYGSCVGYKILKDPVLLLNDATAIQYIFQEKNSDYLRSKYIKNLKYLFSGGIFLSDGENWKQQRAEALPAFASGNLPEMTEHMAKTMEACLQRWDKDVGIGKAIDMNFELTRYALDVAVGALFHLKRDRLIEVMIHNLGILLRESEARIWAIFSIPQSISMLRPKYRKALKALRSSVDDLIAERRRNPCFPNDLLSRAILAYERKETSYKVLQDKIVAFLTSAHETSANSMVWALHELSKRPDIVAKVREEVESIWSGELLTYDDIKKLPYTKQVFEEALRLYPSVWTMSREAAVDDHLPLDDGSLLKIEKGTTVMLSPYVIHRNKKYWPDPSVFDPDRFSVEGMKGRPRMAYIPFSGGERLCLGFRFAQIEAVVALAMLCLKYDFELLPNQNVEPVPNITLRPSCEMYFRLQPRVVARISSLDLVDKSSPDTKGIPAQGCPFHQSGTDSLLLRNEVHAV